MLRRIKTLNRRGDTIVEVMVVLTVLGLAIGIAYATANSSLLATKGAQENSQATAVLQSQIEALRYMVPDSNPSDPITNVLQAGPYCISDTYTVLSAASSACTKEGRYQVAITYDNTSEVFTLKSTWPDIQGDGDDTVTLVYRLHQDD